MMLEFAYPKQNEPLERCRLYWQQAKPSAMMGDGWLPIEERGEWKKCIYTKQYHMAGSTWDGRVEDVPCPAASAFHSHSSVPCWCEKSQQQCAEVISVGSSYLWKRGDGIARNYFYILELANLFGLLILGLNFGWNLRAKFLEIKCTHVRKKENEWKLCVHKMVLTCGIEDGMFLSIPSLPLSWDLLLRTGRRWGKN